jgi:hypothetical protein
MFIAISNRDLSRDTTYSDGDNIPGFTLKVARSFDGKTWEFISTNSYSDVRVQDMIIVNNRAIAVGHNTHADSAGDGYCTQIYADIENLTLWDRNNPYVSFAGDGDSTVNCNTIAYKDGVYVLSGTEIMFGTSAILYSIDGIYWEQATIVDSQTESLADNLGIVATESGFLLYGGGSFGGAFTYYSEDGIEWHKVNDLSKVYVSGWIAAAHNNEKLLLLNYNDEVEGIVIYTFSNDGTYLEEIWVDQYLAVYGWSDIIYGNNQFVMTSTEGVSAISTDGITWRMATEADLTPEEPRLEQNGEDVTDKVIDLVTKELRELVTNKATVQIITWEEND